MSALFPILVKGILLLNPQFPRKFHKVWKRKDFMRCQEKQWLPEKPGLNQTTRGNILFYLFRRNYFYGLSHFFPLEVNPNIQAKTPLYVSNMRKSKGKHEETDDLQRNLDKHQFISCTYLSKKYSFALKMTNRKVFEEKLWQKKQINNRESRKNNLSFESCVKLAKGAQNFLWYNLNMLLFIEFFLLLRLASRFCGNSISLLTQLSLLMAEKSGPKKENTWRGGASIRHIISFYLSYHPSLFFGKVRHTITIRVAKMEYHLYRAWIHNRFHFCPYPFPAEGA